MTWHRAPRVLAIGIDAAEPSLIKELIAREKLPVLKSLLAEGRWLRVESPANIGSGSVWPTFITGEEPANHGVYGEWAWQPEIMGLRRYNGRHLRPFWKSLLDQNVRVGIIDVPFAPFLNLSSGFELSEWGPHDLLEGRGQFSPAKIAEVVNNHFAPHPLSLNRLDTGGPHDRENLQALATGCLQGIKLRGELASRLIAQTEVDLAVVVFTEIHHSAHYLWHTINMEDSIYPREAFRNLPAVNPSLEDIYVEVDRQVGELTRGAASDATVMVFSLHGMRTAYGVPSFLEPLLAELGYARFSDWHSQSWTERAIRLMAAGKRRMPDSLRRLYYQTVPPTTTLRIARPTMMSGYDWSKTRAFSLPADQHGWIHLNLVGREARGIVAPKDYEATCTELEQTLQSLKAADGRPIIREVIRTAPTAERAMSQRLPDIVLLWEEAAFSAPLKIQGSKLELLPAGRKFTGRHARDGFCILKGRDELCTGEVLHARDMHRVIQKSLLGN